MPESISPNAIDIYVNDKFFGSKDLESGAFKVEFDLPKNDIINLDFVLI